MSTFYVNNSGTNKYPYSSPQTGATNFVTLFVNTNFTDGDEIIFVSSGGIINDADCNIQYLTKSITIKSDSDTVKAIWNLGKSGTIKLQGNGASNLSFIGIDFEFEYDIDGMYTPYFITSYSNLVNFTVDNCEINVGFENNDIYKKFIRAGDGVDYFDVTNFIFKNSKTLNISSVLTTFRGVDGLTVEDNDFRTDYASNNGFLFNILPGNSDVSNVTIKNNSFYNIYICIYVSKESSISIPTLENFVAYNNSVRNCYSFIRILSVNILGAIINSNYCNTSTNKFVYLYQDTTETVYTNISIYDNTLIGGLDYGIALNNDSDSGEFTNINVYNNNLDCVGGVYCGIANSDFISIYDNTIISDSYGILLDCGSSSLFSTNVFVNNNIITNYNVASILLQMVGADINGIDIKNNNLISNYSSPIVFLSQGSLAKNIKFYDNIVYETSGTAISIVLANIDDNTSIIDHNCFNFNPTMSLSNTLVGAITTIGTHNIIDNPDWVDISNDNYYLNSSSPCINAGLNGSGNDIGAIDYIENGINLSIQDSVLINFSNKNDKDVSLSLQNNSFDRDTTSEFGVYKNTNNQFDFEAPSSYPLVKDEIGYNKDLAWLNDNKSEFAPFSGIYSPPNPGVGYPSYLEYPVGIFGFSRITGE